MSVEKARITLKHSTKSAAFSLSKLLNSAISNAKDNLAVNNKDLIIKKIEVNSGIVLKRMMPRARGSGAQIKKRTSHVTLVLDSKPQKKPNPKSQMTSKIKV